VNRPFPEHRHPDHQPHHLLGRQSTPPHRRRARRLQRFPDPLRVHVPPNVRGLLCLGERGYRLKVLVDFHDLPRKIATSSPAQLMKQEPFSPQKIPIDSDLLRA
jgi:hypothetical protein